MKKKKLLIKILELMKNEQSILNFILLTKVFIIQKKRLLVSIIYLEIPKHFFTSTI